MILVRRFNCGNVYFHSLFTGAQVGVYKRSGELMYLPFLGFAEREHAKWMQLDGQRVKPVKLEVYGYYPKSRVGDRFIQLKPCECVQGCMTAMGVYAIIEDGKPRIMTI